MANMNARERVMAAVNHVQPDRPPYTFGMMPELSRRLQAELGVDSAGLQHMFGGDLRGIQPRPGITASPIHYADPTIEVTPEGYYRDIWGVDFALVAHAHGNYVNLARHPLKGATSAATLDAHRHWPKAEWWDYRAVRADCLAASPYATIGHSRGFFEISWFLCGLDDFLTSLVLAPGLACAVMDRVLAYLLERMERVLSAAAGSLDLFQLNDDVGTQNGLMIGPELWRRYIKPRLKQQVDLCKRYQVRVEYHSCGSVREIIPDLIELGIDIINPVQSRAAGMDPFELKREFGPDLTLHGGIDEQELLPYGSPQEVSAYTKRLVDIVGRNGGLIVAPCHTLQNDTPTENILAMWQVLANTA
jgi:uroporphyrinogen decarboxylase